MPGYNPETILREQFESQRQQIQKRFQAQWDEVNNRARAGLYKSQKDRDGDFFAIHSKAAQVLGEFDQIAEQATGQFQQIDKLAEMGAIKDPDEVKWRMVLGPEAEKAMFPSQADPRDELREINATKKQVFDDVKQYARGKDGKLYPAKVEGDYYTDKPDRSMGPVSQQEEQLWIANMDALHSLRQAGAGAAQNIADMGVPNPNRYEDLMRSAEEDHWLKRAAKRTGKGLYGLSGPGLMHKSIKKIRSVFASEPTGTFAQKAQESIIKPRQPREQAAPKVIRQRNKRTGQERISYDGGKTWQTSG
jgi:hypothetical protein